MFQRDGAIKVIAINIGILVGLAVIAELIFGRFLSGPDFGMLNIPTNVRYRFDVSGLYPGERLARYSRDSYGLRGHYDDPSRIDILTVGGSTTNQLYVDDDLTWQETLGRAFGEAGRDVTVVNAAVDGQSALGHIAIFQDWLPQIPGLKARYVLAYVGINDISASGASQYDRMRSTSLSRRIRYWIMNKSALYNLFRTVRGMLRAYDAKLVHGSGGITGRSWIRLQPVASPLAPPTELVPTLNGYRERLRDLVRTVRKFGAEAILVTQPTAEFRVRDGWVWVVADDLGKPKSAAFETMRAFNDVTLEVCREAAAICVDLAGALAFEDGDFYDRVHNTPAGTRKVGRFLYEALRDRI